MIIIETRLLGFNRNMSSFLDQSDLELLPEISQADPSLCDPVHHPNLFINYPLRLLSREYKHPLSMYEDAKKNVQAR